MTDRVAFWTASLAAALHLAFANRYDLFRDELYFIVCGRHAAFGYVDQPPLVPVTAAALYRWAAKRGSFDYRPSSPRQLLRGSWCVSSGYFAEATSPRGLPGSASASPRCSPD